MVKKVHFSGPCLTSGASNAHSVHTRTIRSNYLLDYLSGGISTKNMNTDNGNEADTVVEESTHVKVTERESQNPEVEISASLWSSTIQLLASHYNHPFNCCTHAA